MKFVVTRASSNDYMEIKEISTIEQLINFKNKVGNIIIGQNLWYKTGKTGIKNIKEWCPSNININEVVNIPDGIEIYDDYRE